MSANGVKNKKGASRLRRNLSWNTLGIAIDTVVAFVVCPFLIKGLGLVEYGAWVTISALTGYFGLLDFGIKGSVGRFTALYQSQGDRRAIHRIISTSALLLVGLGSISLLGVLSLSFFVPSVFGSALEPSERDSIRVAMLLGGIQLWALLPTRLLEGLLWGHQRFDRLNQIQIPTLLFRGTASIVMVSLGYGLVAVAFVGLASTLMNSLALLVSTPKEYRSSTVSFKNVSRHGARELLNFGTANSLRSIASMLPQRFAPVGVSYMLGVSFVAPLSIAARLTNSASALIIAASGVFTPHATTLHAKNDTAGLLALHIRGGSILAFANIFIFTCFLVMGKPFIELWVGSELASVYPLLVLLALGRCLTSTQLITRAIITALAKHWPLAWAGLLQMLVTIVAGFAALKFSGLLAFTYVLAGSEILFSGAVSLLYGCWLIGCNWRSYCMRLLYSSFPMLLLSSLFWMLTRDAALNSWLKLIATGSTYAFLSLGCYALTFEGKKVLQLMIQKVSDYALSH